MIKKFSKPSFFSSLIIAFFLLLSSIFFSPSIYSSSTGSPVFSPASLPPFSLTPHPPLEIANDTALEAASVSGSGTSLDPFLLSGWNITSSSHGIHIHDTTKHFEISNCLINAGNSYPYSGIYIDNIAEGSAFISNNTIFDCNIGIRVDYSDNVTLQLNNCSSNRFGIHVWYSDNLKIESNFIFFNEDGVMASYSANFTFLANNVSNNLGIGLSLDDVDFGIIHSNSFSNNLDYACDIQFGSEENMIHHNTFISNKIGHSQANDQGSSTHWFEASSHEGNFWDDYSLSGDYLIDGIMGSSDPYPLNDLDGDLIPDWYESREGLNLYENDSSVDLDFDGLTNYEEYLALTSCRNSDTDNDGLSDKIEVENSYLDPLVDDSQRDSDNDSMPNLWEYQMGLDLSLNDSQEDLDNDLMPNLWEYQNDLNASTNDASEDLDGDGLTNLEEFNLGTLANDTDTDDDKMTDGWEVDNNLDPLLNDSSVDIDNDGLSNLEEWKHDTDPYDSDSDNDGFSDGEEVAFGSNPNNAWSNKRNNYLLIFLITVLVIGGVGGPISFFSYRFIKKKQFLEEQREELSILFESISSLKAQVLTIHSESSLDQSEARAQLFSLATNLNNRRRDVRSLGVLQFSQLARSEKSDYDLAFELEDVAKNWEETFDLILSHELTVITIFYLCEFLLAELRQRHDPDVFDEVNTYSSRLLEVAEQKELSSLTAETYWLQSQLVLLKLDVKESRRLLSLAKSLAEKHGFTRLAFQISSEYETLLNQLEEWESMGEEVSADQLKTPGLAQIEAQVVKQEEEIEGLEEPIFVLMLLESGSPIFSHKFTVTEDLDDLLISGFISAINTAASSFMSEAFTGSLPDSDSKPSQVPIEQMRYHDFTLILRFIDPVMFSYVFKGTNPKALQKLDLLVNAVKTSEVWDNLNKLMKTGRGLGSDDTGVIKEWINEVFLNDKK